MKGKDSSENKGFSFVTFRSVELASKAIDELNNTEFKVTSLLMLHIYVNIIQTKTVAWRSNLKGNLQIISCDVYNSMTKILVEPIKFRGVTIS